MLKPSGTQNTVSPDEKTELGTMFELFGFSNLYGLGLSLVAVMSTLPLYTASSIPVANATLPHLQGDPLNSEISITSSPLTVSISR